MKTFEKLVDYRIQFLGKFYSGKRGEEITIDESLSENETLEVEQAIKLGLIKQIGGDTISTETNADLEKAEAKLNEIVNDIMTMKQKDLRLKYAPIESFEPIEEIEPATQD